VAGGVGGVEGVCKGEAAHRLKVSLQLLYDSLQLDLQDVVLLTVAVLDLLPVM